LRFFKIYDKIFEVINYPLSSAELAGGPIILKEGAKDYFFYKNMNQYELCALFAGSQTEEEINKISKTVSNLLEEAQAEVKFTYVLGRKKLAYKIEGQSHGSYKVWLLELDPDKIQTLNEKLRLSKDVLRHIITKIEKISIEEKINAIQEPKKEKPEERQGPEQKKERPASVQKEKTEKVEEKLSEKASIDQLNEKLDELLESDKI